MATLQQLRYLIAVAEYGSINAAARELFATQSNLSTAIKDLEQELGVTIFTRSNRGVALTNDGTELLGYARQVIEQADMLERRYAEHGSSHVRLAVSTQHYAFSVQAFVNVAETCTGDEYDLVLRESTTAEIIEDVRSFRSEIGVLYTDDFNRRVLQNALLKKPTCSSTPCSRLPRMCLWARIIRSRNARSCSTRRTWRLILVIHSSRVR